MDLILFAFVQQIVDEPPLHQGLSATEGDAAMSSPELSVPAQNAQYFVDMVVFAAFGHGFVETGLDTGVARASVADGPIEHELSIHYRDGASLTRGNAVTAAFAFALAIHDNRFLE
jgi:hypothetical protein